MKDFLTNLDAWIVAVGFAAAMLAAWFAGLFAARKRGGLGEQPSKLNDAILALLGLFLAFTFSMSLTRHEQRRQMAVADSNAIGDFYTAVSLLPDPFRTSLQQVLRRYVEHRLALAPNLISEPDLQRRLDEIRAMQTEMQSLVKSAIESGTPLAVPLVTTLNEVTSSHAARLAAIRDRLPLNIMLLLFAASVLALAVTGYNQGLAKDWTPGTTLGFIALIAMVVWVILDLNQPQQGMITISQEPLEQLLKGMEPETTAPARATTGT